MFDFDRESQPIVSTLLEKIIQKSLIELQQEEELNEIFREQEKENKILKNKEKKISKNLEKERKKQKNFQIQKKIFREKNEKI